MSTKPGDKPGTLLNLSTGHFPKNSEKVFF